MSPPVRTVSSEVTSKVEVLEALRDSDREAERTCRIERMEAESRLGERVGKLEVSMGSLKASLTAWAALGAILGGGIVQLILRLLVK